MFELGFGHPYTTSHHLQGELVREARESAVASTSGVPLQGSRPSVPSFLAADDDEGAEDASGLRQMFPMSFGTAAA